MAAEDESIAAEVEEQRASIESPARRAGGGAPVRRRLRRRRRRGHGERRRRRHRLPGLGRDAAAHRDALGRAARDEGRAEGGLARGRRPGIKSATFLAKGENAYGLFSAEKGVHRLVRISPFDSAARRHTAFAGRRGGAVRGGDAPTIEIEPDDLQIDTYRASGAGGQHVNKTDSAVRITHKPTGHGGAVPERALAVGQQGTPRWRCSRAKLIELEEQQRREEIAKEKGEAQDVGWGSQIRSYVLHPYTMVKDHRTERRGGQRPGRARRRPRRVRAGRAAAPRRRRRP